MPTSARKNARGGNAVQGTRGSGAIGDRLSVRDQSSVSRDNGIRKLSNRNDVKYHNRGGNADGSYTEEQYNAFGWASYNSVLSAYERDTLLSRFADFKHNRHKYPVTRWGEAVLHSTETPDVIIYVRASSSIRVPEITRIVKIVASDSRDVSKIRERIVVNEEKQVLSPYESIGAYYGEELLKFHRKRDYASFREYLAREKGRDRKETVSYRGEQQDRGRGVRESKSDLRGNGKVKLQDRDLVVQNDVATFISEKTDPAPSELAGLVFLTQRFTLTEKNGYWTITRSRS